MKILLSKKKLGTEANFIIENEMGKWSNEETAEYVIGDMSSSRSVDPLLQLYNIEMPSIVDDKYVSSMRHVTSDEVPWQYVIPRKEYIRKFRNTVSKSKEAMKEVRENKYSDFFLSSNRIFHSLSSSAIDLQMLSDLIEANDVASLRSLKEMVDESTLPPPTYSRISTKTGRLTITSGPQILTLKKEFRRVFKSSFQGGSLFEIDFVSLEPRVALNLAAGNESQDDVYQSFIDKHALKITRETAKLAVLCALYGAGTSKLTSVLKKDGSSLTARQLLSKISHFFGVQPLTKMLQEQSASGYITNYFGRPIEVDDNRGSMLINNFLQSTAADLAIEAFSEFAADKSFCGIPLFIIHDALIIDVHPKDEPKLSSFVKKGFMHEQLGRFPLKLKRLL